MADPGNDPKVLKQRILRHYCYCLGQGAGGKWVKGNALDAMIDRFEPYIEEIIKEEKKTGNPKLSLRDQWQEDKFVLLQLFREIGRVADMKSQGKPFISKGDLALAWDEVVEKNRLSTPEELMQGRWCDWGS